MEDFRREIERRVHAGLEAYQRPIRERRERRERAREAFAAVGRRFVRAASAANGCLRVFYSGGRRADRRPGYALVWYGCPPRRELCLRLDEARGVVHWELASAQLGLSQEGSMRSHSLGLEFVDRLICALLDQETWQRSVLPSLRPGMVTQPAGRQVAAGGAEVVLSA